MESFVNVAPELTVVVLAYNEEDTLERTCQEILETITTLSLSTEVLIVDDGSTDRTGVLSDKLAATDGRVRVVHHCPNLGLGGVYRTGFAQSRGKYVTFLPADGQYPAAIIGEFLPFMSTFDMVLGYLPKRESSLLAKGLSAGERLLYRILLGPMPKFQGILMFRRSLLSNHLLLSQGRGWAVLLEFILKCTRAGCRVKNVPTEVRSRTHGSSKVNNVATVLSNLRQVFALRRTLGRR
jgi:glycosyltransferase involved in cell wall biosynthesis